MPYTYSQRLICAPGRFMHTLTCANARWNSWLFFPNWNGGFRQPRQPSILCWIIQKYIRDGWFKPGSRIIPAFIATSYLFTVPEMNQVEQWFSILQRKRLRISDFSDLGHLAERLMALVAEWNAHAHPFNWSSKSAAKVMAKCEVHSPQAVAA